MEAHLQPLDFRAGAGWSLQELEEKAQQHMVSILCILKHIFGLLHFSFIEPCLIVVMTRHLCPPEDPRYNLLLNWNQDRLNEERYSWRVNGKNCLS
jgi:hypothetical protein